MNRNRLLFFTLLSFVLFAIPITLNAHEKIDLNGQWQFFFAKDAATADLMTSKGFYDKEFDSSNFDSIAVPSCWAVLGYEEPRYRFFENDEGSEGLYLKSFTLPSEWKGKRMELNFGGVYASAEIWLNGKWIGRHDSGYTSFSYDVSKAAKAGEENLLAVRVRQTYPGYRCDTYDDWSLGGIYRPVNIVAMPAKRWIEDVREITSFSDNYKKADVEVRVMVEDAHKTTLPGNYRSPGNSYELKVTLLNAKGIEVASQRQTIQSHTANAKETRIVLSVENPELWNAEHPYLYTLRTELIEDGLTTHQDTRKIGLREISTTGGVFRINGVAVKLRGINRHDEHPDVGRATTKEHYLQDITLMKQANINYIRACHYQHAKGFIEMCDSLGMYVGSEVSLGGAEEMMQDRGFYGGMATRVMETVNRDLDNPSVIYWSIGNEDGFSSLFYMAAKMIKALDGTRPVLYPWNADESLPKEIDILAPHYWTAHEYDSLASSSTRPIITTEYVHAYGTERFGGLEDSWKALTKHPSGAGGAVWMWADQGIKTPVKITNPKFSGIEKDEYLRISTDGWDGITDSYRNPTRDYYELKAVYAPVKADSAVVTPHNGIAKVTLHNGCDFTPLSEFTQKWTLMVDGKTLDSGEEVIEALPHEKADLLIPTDKIGTLKKGQTAYIRISTINKDGFETGVNTIRLRVKAKETPAKGKVSVETGSELITVRSGRNVYSFSYSTGSLLSASKDGRIILKDLTPSVWHNLIEGEGSIKNKTAENINLEKFEPKVLAMEIEESTKEKVTITSKVEYSAGKNDTVTVEYKFYVSPEGELEINYILCADISAASLLPLSGVSFKVETEDAVKQWFGLGPEDAYPNKKTAPQLGLYDGEDSFGCKAIDWVEVKNGKASLRLSSEGSYLVRDPESKDTIRIATQVLGRSEKGRLKDEHYKLSPEGTYKGMLTIE